MLVSVLSLVQVTVYWALILLSYSHRLVVKNASTRGWEKFPPTRERSCSSVLTAAGWAGLRTWCWDPEHTEENDWANPLCQTIKSLNYGRCDFSEQPGPEPLTGSWKGFLNHATFWGQRDLLKKALMVKLNEKYIHTCFPVLQKCFNDLTLQKHCHTPNHA